MFTRAILGIAIHALVKSRLFLLAIFAGVAVASGGQRLSKGPGANPAASTIPSRAEVQLNPSLGQRNWAMCGGSAENNHYSTLQQINRSNVKRLAIAWTFDTHETGGLQTSPIEVDGVL